MDTARIWFDRLMAAGAGVSCFAMFAVVFVSSLSRYAFDAPFVWSEELAKYAMIYGTMFGVVLAYNRASHMRFTLFADLVGRRLWIGMAVAADLLAIAVGAILAWSGWLFAAARGGIPSPGIGAPMAYAQAAIAIGGACLAIAAALDLLTRRRAARGELVAL